MDHDTLLDTIYEAMPDTLGVSYYDPLNGTPAELYITVDGECWKVNVEPHNHEA